MSSVRLAAAVVAWIVLSLAAGVATMIIGSEAAPRLAMLPGRDHRQRGLRSAGRVAVGCLLGGPPRCRPSACASSPVLSWWVWSSPGALSVAAMGYAVVGVGAARRGARLGRPRRWTAWIAWLP